MDDRKGWAGIRAELRRSALTVLAIIGVLWGVHLVNTIGFGGTLVRWGIEPRTTDGLIGILSHPLLHGSWTHLISNTIGFALLGGLVILRDPRDFWMVSLLAVLIGGVGIWLLGRPGPHIGASGVVFGYFGYLLLTGVFERRIGAILISIVSFFLWGGLLLGLSPLQRGISWEGHLFGLLGGGLGAWLRARRRGRA